MLLRCTWPDGLRPATAARHTFNTPSQDASLLFTAQAQSSSARLKRDLCDRLPADAFVLRHNEQRACCLGNNYCDRRSYIFQKSDVSALFPRHTDGDNTQRTGATLSAGDVKTFLLISQKETYAKGQNFVLLFVIIT